jgi:hypothetical protein
MSRRRKFRRRGKAVKNAAVRRFEAPICAVSPARLINAFWGWIMRGPGKVVRLAILGVVSLCLQACGPKPGEEESLRAVFDQVRAGQFEEIESRLSEQNRTPETRSTLEQLRDIIPSEPPESVSRLRWEIHESADSRTIASVHEYAYPDRILIVTTTLKRDGASGYSIENFHINAFNPAQARANDFTLQGKPPRQLAFFGALVASVVLMIVAVLGTLLTRSFKRKWLWVIISLVGAPVFLMNWATGAWQPSFTLSLIGTAVTRGLSPVDPWIVTFQLPIGALVTLSLLLSHWMGRAPAGGQQS